MESVKKPEIDKELEDAVDKSLAQGLDKAFNMAIDESMQRVMDLFYGLREIGGTPNLKDLVKLAKRIKSLKR